jgi:hypothetical protein
MAADPAADLAACVQALQDIIAAPAAAVATAERALTGLMMRRMGVCDVPPGRVPVKIPDLPVGGWAKWVLSVRNEKGGFAFEGPFLRSGQVVPLPEYALVLMVLPADAARSRPCYLGHVTSRGDLDLWYKDRSAKWWVEAKRAAEKALSEWNMRPKASAEAAEALVLQT